MLSYVSAIRRVIAKYSSVPLPPVPSNNNEKASYGPIHLQRKAFLFDTFDFTSSTNVFESETPLPMEYVGQVCHFFHTGERFLNSQIVLFKINFCVQFFGFALYVTEYRAKRGGRSLFIPKVLF